MQNVPDKSNNMNVSHEPECASINSVISVPSVAKRHEIKS